MQTGSALILMVPTGASSSEDQDLLWTPISGRPCLARVLAVCEATPILETVLILISPSHRVRVQALVQEHAWHKISPTILPWDSDRRTALSSALTALTDLAPNTRWIAIHDARYPLITPELLQTGFEAVKQAHAVSAAVPVKDTIKLVQQDIIQTTLDRNQLWSLQSPQIFALDLLSEALHSPEARTGFRDEAALLTRLGKTVTIFPGSYNNLQIRTSADLLLAEALLQNSSL